MNSNRFKNFGKDADENHGNRVTIVAARRIHDSKKMHHYKQKTADTG